MSEQEIADIKRVAREIACIEEDFEIKFYDVDNHSEEANLFFSTLIDEITKKETQQIGA